jgi:hypothetical protein
MSRRLDAIEQHPGTVAHQRWRSLSQVHQVLLANEAELLALLDQVEGDDQLAVRVTSNIGPQDLKDAFYRELIRRLHNYLSALKMLVDHTRNLMRAYGGTTFASEYSTRTAVFASDGRTRVMQKLRDYLLHYQLPPIGVSVSVKTDGDSEKLEVFVFLNRDSALRWSDWPKAAREFLTAQEPHIPLRDLIRGYSSDTATLYGWLYPQFTDLHADDIAQRNALVVELQGAANTPGHPDWRAT